MYGVVLSYCIAQHYMFLAFSFQCFRIKFKNGIVSDFRIIVGMHQEMGNRILAKILLVITKKV